MIGVEGGEGSRNLSTGDLGGGLVGILIEVAFDGDFSNRYGSIAILVRTTIFNYAYFDIK